MRTVSLSKITTLRRERNGHLIKRLQDGESLTSFSSESSWYPPRPTITKDPDAVKKLYGTDHVTEEMGVAKTKKADLPIRLLGAS